MHPALRASCISVGKPEPLGWLVASLNGCDSPSESRQARIVCVMTNTMGLRVPGAVVIVGAR